MDNPLTALPVEMLRRRHSIKWRQYDPDVLPLWVAEMDTPLAEPIADALSAALSRGDTGYAHPGRLREAYAGFTQRHYGWTPDPAHMIVVPDVVRGLTEVVRRVGVPGDGVVINTPVYPPLFSMIESAGRVVVESPLRRADDGTYALDLDALDRDLASARVSAYLFLNPQNPTGLVHSHEELTAIAALAEKHRVRLLVDEVHAPLTYPGQTHVPIATIDAPAAREAIIFASASKAWNLPGLKAALIVGADAAAWPLLSTLPPDVTFGTALPGVVAGEAAFDHGDEWLAALIAGLDHNRALLSMLIAKKLPGVGYVPPQATFLAWLDMRSRDLGDDPAGPLLERGRVALSSGPAFGAPGRGHVRLNLATSPSILTEAVRRMASVF